MAILTFTTTTTTVVAAMITTQKLHEIGTLAILNFAFRVHLPIITTTVAIIAAVILK